MARPVSLSDEAFSVLRSEKRASESDSDVVLRLAREARARRKDPMAFLRRRHEPAWDAATLDEFRRRMRQADVDRAEHLGRRRTGVG